MTALAARLHRTLVAAPVDEALDAAHVLRAVRREAPLLGERERSAVVSDVLAALVGLGPLEALLADDDVTDVLVNGDGRIWVERAGQLSEAAARVTTPEVFTLIERVVAPLGLRVDRSSPLVDARLPDGSRVHAVVPPLAVDGPCLSIRRFATRPIPLASFCGDAVARLLSDAVRDGANVIVAGATGAGKTTMLNALASAIPAEERVVTVEEAAELRLPGAHVIRLETRPANADGSGAVTARDLLRAALRMRPDRIIVGECRGAEAFDMIQALHTGHRGSLSTCHAGSPADALARLETMALLAGAGLPFAAIRSQLHAAVDLVVHVARAQDGGRMVTSVAKPVREWRGDGDRVRGVATATEVFDP